MRDLQRSCGHRGMATTRDTVPKQGGSRHSTLSLVLPLVYQGLPQNQEAGGRRNQGSAIHPRAERQRMDTPCCAWQKRDLDPGRTMQNQLWTPAGNLPAFWSELLRREVSGMVAIKTFECHWIGKGP